MKKWIASALILTFTVFAIAGGPGFKDGPGKKQGICIRPTLPMYITTNIYAEECTMCHGRSGLTLNPDTDDVQFQVEEVMDFMLGVSPATSL